MTFAEISTQLPNDFHDAEIERFTFEQRSEILLIDVDVWVGTMDDPVSQRERYRQGQIRFTGVDFFALPAPRRKPLEWRILQLDERPHIPSSDPPPLLTERERRLSSYTLWLGYSELLIAADTFDFRWTSAKETNRGA